MHVRLRGRGNPECPGPVTALHPLAVLDGVPQLVFHFDEAGSLRSGRAVEHDVYVKCWHDVYVTCFCVTCCHRSSYGWMPSLISTRIFFFYCDSNRWCSAVDLAAVSTRYCG